MPITRIHVNQHNIKHNVKHGSNLPVFTVKQGSKNTYTNRVSIQGPSELVYSDDGTDEYSKLSCGARCWIETHAEVECIDPVEYQDVKRAKEACKTNANS